ncbi:MAG: acyl carrier protein [Dehalococcoidia bacterium]|nr:acyl carrier protein [Dehalococcoidia bacterium]
MSKIFNNIKKILIDELGVDEAVIQPSASFIDDLNMDPDDIAEFFTTVEDVFSMHASKVNIPEAESDNLLTIQTLVEYLQDIGIED